MPKKSWKIALQIIRMVIKQRYEHEHDVTRIWENAESERCSTIITSCIFDAPHIAHYIFNVHGMSMCVVALHPSIMLEIWLQFNRLSRRRYCITFMNNERVCCNIGFSIAHISAMAFFSLANHVLFTTFFIPVDEKNCYSHNSFHFFPSYNFV